MLQYSSREQWGWATTERHDIIELKKNKLLNEWKNEVPVISNEQAKHEKDKNP